MFFSRIRQFWGPWLAYATLSGIGAGLAFFPLGIIDFLLVSRSTDSIPIMIAYGFVGGSLSGLSAGLIGGKPGYSWGLLSPLGIAFLFPPTTLLCVLLIISSAIGVLLPNWLLSNERAIPAWLQPLSQWLKGTWLYKPPSRALITGIFLPLLVGIGLSVWTIAPIYASYPNYAARLGFWKTWEFSSAFASKGGRTYTPSCHSKLQQIMLGLHQYVQDYDEFYPTKPTRAEDGVAAVIQPYLKSTQLFQCPAEFYRPEVYFSEATYFQSGDFSDYWISSRFYNLNEAQVTNSFTTVVWGDGNTGKGEGTAAYSIKSIPSNFAPAARHNPTHGGGANYAFADGHVKWLKVGVVSNFAAPSKGSPTMVP